MFRILDVLQSGEPMAYKVGYSVVTTLVAGSTSWVVGKMALERIQKILGTDPCDINGNQSSEYPHESTDAGKARSMFRNFISPERISREVADLVARASEADRSTLYAIYKTLSETDRFALEPVLQSHRGQISSMTDIFLIIGGWQAGMENMEIIHETDAPETDRDDTWDEMPDSEEILSRADIERMKEEWKLTSDEANFLLSSGKIL